MKKMRCWAEIDLAALERNIAKTRAALPKQMKYVSVVKADAYGHGIHPSAARLMQSGVDLFAVANVKEAIDIREMGSGWPILVLGPLLEEEDQALIDYDLIASLSNASELKGSATWLKQTIQQSRYTSKSTQGWEEWAAGGKKHPLS